MIFTARQAKQEFGDVDLGDTVKKALGENSNNKFEFVHMVFPNKDYDGKFGSKKFASKILNISDSILIESDNYKNGYDRMPYKIVKFGESEDGNTGSSPSVDVLPTVKMCNEATKTFIESSENASGGTLIVEDDGVVGQPVRGPNGLIVIRSGSKYPEILKTGANPQLNAEFLNVERQIIKQSFLNDVFDSLTYYRQETAAELKEIEIQKKIEEGFIVLAPVIASLQRDFLDPLILEIDEEVNGKPEVEMKIVYQGRLVLMMSAMQTNAIETHLAKWQPFQETHSVYDNIDMDKSFKECGINSGVPANLFKDEEVVARQRQQRNAPAEAMADAEIAVTGADAYKKVIDAQK
jgi:hypothetical protein